MTQPPPCGCVLKLAHWRIVKILPKQPPPCGCVLKPYLDPYLLVSKKQPPPCGCVLKRYPNYQLSLLISAAASVRLCVETIKFESTGM